MRNKFKPTHGLSDLPEYSIWGQMKQRCDNHKCDAYINYGARGISYCKEWGKFENFYNDMGARPSKNHTIERKDNNGNYEKSNCVWTTRKEQARNFRNNRILEYNGEKKCISEWAEDLGITHDAIAYRLKHGYTIEQIITKYKKPFGRQVEFNGQMLTINKIEKALGLSKGVIKHRIKSGLSERDAISLGIGHGGYKFNKIKNV